MKKTILFASAVGMGGGLLYLLTKSRGADGHYSQTENRHETGDETQPVGEEDRDHPLSSMKMLGNSDASENRQPEPLIHDQGTDQSEASRILKRIRDGVFEGSDEKLALALGRPEEEIESLTNGAALIDGDVIMKARGLAAERGMHIE